MITKLIDYLEKNRKLFKIPENEKIAIELHPPWRKSHNGTCQYIVYVGKKRIETIVIRESISLYGIRCRCNPYKPQFSEDVDNFLPENKGSFSLNNKEYYWSDRIQEKTLMSIISENPRDPDTWKLVSDFFHKFSSTQIENSVLSSDFYDELKELINQKIKQKEGTLVFEEFCDLNILKFNDQKKVPCSWSHGDLWSQDIFLVGTSWRIIDWEYSLQVAPIGSDMIDLYITLAEHNLKMSTPDAWRGFWYNEIPQLSKLREDIFSVWSTAGFDDEQEKSTYKYALIRSVGRIISQEGETNKLDLKVYSQIIFEVTDKKIHTPLSVIQHIFRLIRNRYRI
ncbi:hypothetical protein [Methanoregula sp.]|uniref:hypothetical protein n=1 Tax=Methanoregula sp. TaxID=2052170 RepID=UPI0035690FD9